MDTLLGIAIRVVAPDRGPGHLGTGPPWLNWQVSSSLDFSVIFLGVLMFVLSFPLLLISIFLRYNLNRTSECMMNKSRSKVKGWSTSNPLPVTDTHTDRHT